jgi:hypothetical protein
MGKAIGRASYIAFGQQTAFGTVQTSLTTAAFIRTGSIFTTRQTQNPRITTGSIMPRSSQLWSTMSLTDFDVTLEYVTHDTALLPLLTGAFGKRIKSGAGPFIHTYIMTDPFVDQADGGGTFYNHSLTVREIPHDGSAGISPRVVQDICINRFVLTMEANAQLRFQLSGTGQKYVASSAPAFTDITGTTLAWQHAIAGANSGLYMGSANPPTTAFLAKRVTFTLENNLRYEPFLGAASGSELALPTRAGFPSAQCAFEMDFDDISSTDAVSLFTDFFATTKENLRIEYYVDANNSLELLATAASVRPGVIDDPKPVYSGEGVVGFNFNLLFYPDDMTGAATDDLVLIQTTGT